MLRSVRRMAFVSARPIPYSSCASGSCVCFPSSSSIVSFHIDACSGTVSDRGQVYRVTVTEGNDARRSRCRHPETPPGRPKPHPRPLPATGREGRGGAGGGGFAKRAAGRGTFASGTRAWCIGRQGERTRIPMDHVLYFVADPSRAALAAARDGLDRVGRRVSALRGQKVRLAFEQSAARTLAKLRSGGIDALVIDARGEPGGVEESSALSLLRGLFGEHDLPRVLSQDRAWLVVDGGSHGTALAFEAGRLHLGGVIATHGLAGDPYEPFWERILSSTAYGRGGKVALC